MGLSTFSLLLFGIHIFLGFEVNKPFKISIKISSTMEYIESDIQNIEILQIDDPIV